MTWLHQTLDALAAATVAELGVSSPKEMGKAIGEFGFSL
jgi:uncharacterized protein YqeY